MLSEACSVSSRRPHETVGVSVARELYDALTDDLLYDPAVGRSTMMGYPCVRRAGNFFASFDEHAEEIAGLGFASLPLGRLRDAAHRTERDFVGVRGDVLRGFAQLGGQPFKSISDARDELLRGLPVQVHAIRCGASLCYGGRSVPNIRFRRQGEAAAAL